MLPVDLVAACASRVVGALLLWYCWHCHQGHWDSKRFCCVQDLPSHRLCWWGEGNGEELGQGCLCCVWGYVFAGTTALSKGSEWWVPLWLEECGHRPLCCCCPITMARSANVARCLESCVLPPLLLLGSLGLWALLPQPGSWDCRHCLCSFSGSVFSMCSSLPTFRCTDVWISGILRCWAEVPLLRADVLVVADWRGETKGAS